MTATRCRPTSPPPPIRSPRLTHHVVVVFTLILLAVLGTAPALAQDDTSAPPPIVEGAEPAPPERASESGEQTVDTVALASFGVAGGFPSYQTGTVQAGVQYRFFGVGARAGWSAAGPALGVHVRGYPPIPIPVPTYVALGASFYDDNIAPYAALGVHIPVAPRWRIDLEGGIASVSVLDQRSWAPHLQLGVSWVVAFDPADVFREPAAGATRSGGRGSACELPSPPDEAGLPGATAQAVAEFLRDAQAAYGSIYGGLSYSYDIVDTDVSGDDAEVRIAYRGSVTELATGNRLSADGRASASFRWTGCAWALTGTRY